MDYRLSVLVAATGETRTLIIHPRASFNDLRNKMIQALSINLKVEEEYFYRIAFMYRSILPWNHFSVVPMGEQVAVTLLKQEENRFFGSISLLFFDMRRVGESQYVKSEKIHDVALVPSSELTDWVTREWHVMPALDSKISNNCSLVESLFWEISSIAVMQGKLQKKNYSLNKKEFWREQYFILDYNSRLWTFSSQTRSSGFTIDKETLLPTFISFSSESVRAHNASSARDLGMFIVFYNDSIRDDPIKLTFKAKSLDEARLWVSAFSSLANADNYVKSALSWNENERDIVLKRNITDEKECENNMLQYSDNDFLSDMDNYIGSAQLDKSLAEMKTLVNASSKLGSMLNNRHVTMYPPSFRLNVFILA
jgi:hypothetical protein